MYLSIDMFTSMSADLRACFRGKAERKVMLGVNNVARLEILDEDPVWLAEKISKPVTVKRSFRAEQRLHGRALAS